MEEKEEEEEEEEEVRKEREEFFYINETNLQKLKGIILSNFTAFSPSRFLKKFLFCIRK